MRITVSQLRRMIREAIDEKDDTQKDSSNTLKALKDRKNNSDSSPEEGAKEDSNKGVENLMNALQKKDKNESFAALDVLLDLAENDHLKTVNGIAKPLAALVSQNKDDAKEIALILNGWFESEGKEDLKIELGPEKEGEKAEKKDDGSKK